MKHLLLMFILVGCSDSPVEYKPKFKAGDCVKDINTYEFKELYKPHVRKILAVGKENYKYAFYTHILETSFTMDDYYEKVDNAVCEARGM